MFNTKSFVISVLLLILPMLTMLATAQRPVPLEKAQRMIFPTPKGLQDHGAYFFQLSTQISKSITVTLYGESKEVLAVVELSKDYSTQTVNYQISLGGRQDFFRVQRLQSDITQATYNVSSSLGESLDFRIEKDATVLGPKQVIKAIHYNDGSSWVRLTARDIIPRGPRVEQATLPRLLQEKLFRTEAHKLIREVVNNLENFANIITGQTPVERNQLFQRQGIIPVSFHRRGCTVTCARIDWPLPLWYCPSQSGDCSCPQAGGIYIMSCPTTFYCNVDCSAFGPGPAAEMELMY